jgi:hypothetical protein
MRPGQTHTTESRLRMSASASARWERYRQAKEARREALRAEVAEKRAAMTTEERLRAEAEARARW